jgi:hypothetical protein
MWDLGGWKFFVASCLFAALVAAGLATHEWRRVREPVAEPPSVPAVVRQMPAASLPVYVGSSDSDLVVCGMP